VRNVGYRFVLPSKDAVAEASSPVEPVETAEQRH
jgi:hypothetical protein